MPLSFLQSYNRKSGQFEVNVMGGNKILRYLSPQLENISSSTLKDELFYHLWGLLRPSCCTNLHFNTPDSALWTYCGEMWSLGPAAGSADRSPWGWRRRRRSSRTDSTSGVKRRLRVGCRWLLEVGSIRQMRSGLEAGGREAEAKTWPWDLRLAVREEGGRQSAADWPQILHL